MEARKRGAARQITKDDAPEADDGNEEPVGTWQKADDVRHAARTAAHLVLALTMQIVVLVVLCVARQHSRSARFAR